MSSKPAVSPVNNISPMAPMNVIADTAEELGFRFGQLNLAQLNKGQLYQGKVVARLDDQGFLVALNGSALRMTLGKETHIGDIVSLRYMGGFPTPTFLLSPLSSDAQSVSHTSISPSAQLINQFLNTVDNKKTAIYFEAQQAVTSSPLNPAGKIANDLRQALVMSGLFYESHLAEHLAGKRPLSAILQEPQNQPAGTLNSLVPQQLQILEQQRLLWHGEVWPRQQMEWEVSRQERHHDQQDHDATAADETMISSKITLDLPRLGKVTASISHVNGHMRIELLAARESTLALLKQNSPKLSESLKAAGQSLDQLTVQAHAQP